MDNRQSKLRVHKLQQIPVFTMREELVGLLGDEELHELVEAKIVEVLEIQTQDPRGTIEYLKREQLVKLINALPAIDDDRIDTLFEEYRYGPNPSFTIYIFDTALIKRPDRLQMQGELKGVIREWSRGITDDLPKLRHLVIDAIYEIIDHDEIIEASYRYQKRLDYIDEGQNPTSVYETLYGFFWINTQEGYVIIHARESAIRRVLELAISEGAGVHLVRLVITKELKNALPFLLEEALRSSRLHDPDPDTSRFRSISITDDDLYAKGYRQWEERYPEIRNARYRVDVDASKETSLTIGFSSGSMSLAGKLTATQFRSWALLSLSEIIKKVNGFKEKPEIYVQTYGFRTVPELNKYSARQKDIITQLIANLLGLKKDPGIGYRDMQLSPLEIASALGNYVFAQYYLECEDETCDLEGYLGCEFCGESTFYVREHEGAWSLECRQHRRNKWSLGVPVEGTCERGHEFKLTQRDLEENLQILPTDELLHTISTIVSQYIPGYEFSDEIESFMLRGSRLYHFEDRAEAPDSRGEGVTIFSTVNVRVVEAGGEVTGVKT